MVSRKLSQRTNAWLIRVDFFYTYFWVNGLCFGYFQIFPKRSPFDQKLRYPLFTMYPDFLTIRYTAEWSKIPCPKVINPCPTHTVTCGDFILYCTRKIKRQTTFTLPSLRSK